MARARSIDLFAVQAFVRAATYRSAGAFRDAMMRLGARCAARRTPAGDGGHVPGLAVFPENIGSFLALGALGPIGPLLRRVDVAAGLAAIARPRRFARAARRAGIRHPEIAALLAVAPEVRAAYESTFREVARSTGLTIVAGSALLPDDDESTDVYNVSYTFDPSGRILGTTRKVNLVVDLEDTLGLTPGRASELRPIETAVGPVGTLVCYDGFAVPHTRREPAFRAVGGAIALRGARIVAQPAANPWPWEGPWVHRARGSAMSRCEQWQTEGLETQLRAMEGTRYAVTAHLIGEVLDQRFDGRSAIYERTPDGAVVVLAEARRADLSPDSEEIVHANVPEAAA